MELFLSTRRVFVLVVLLGIFVLAARGITDPDIWWHLRTGQDIVSSRAVPHFDSYSYTYLGQPWTAHEWLSQVLIYNTYRAGGMAGLIVIFAVIITAAYTLVYVRCPGSPYVAGIATLLAALASMPFWGARPQMFTLLLASVFLYVLRNHTGRGLWFLPPLMLLWVNLHAGFPLGLALILLTAIGVVLDGILSEGRGWREAVATALPLAITFLVCTAVVPLNPNGWRLFLYPFQTLISPSMQTYIDEWVSPNFHLPRFQIFAGLLLVSFLAMAANGSRKGGDRARQLVLLSATTWAALGSARHIPIFALIAAPILAVQINAMLEGRPWAKWLVAPSERATKPVLNVFLVLLLILAAGVRVARTISQQTAIEARALPTAAVEFLLTRNLPAPVFNSYDWGGYMIWRAPGYKVFVDGRADLYGDTFLDNYVRICRGRQDWQAEFSRYGIQTVIIETDGALAALLRQDTYWTTVFEDKQAAIFTRR